MPELFEVVALNEDGYEHLPEPTVPYFVHAKEGDYLHKNTQIGNVLVKTQWSETQKHLGRIGFAGGVFTWKGDKVPAKVISQAHDFFLRIWNAKQTEAEVLITKHNDTGEFRLFVPYQRVSGMGVKSIYEPTHVDRTYTVVGTLHSHCNFTAFHSGTDSGDASDMDGVHFTIGHVDRGIPEIVGMVAMNGKEFHYAEVSDIAETVFGSHTAPEWWDQYVFGPADTIPTIKPAGLTSLTQEHWDEFLGRALVVKKSTWTPVTASTPPTNEWKNWSPNLRPHWGPSENYDWRREVYGAGKQQRPDPDTDLITGVLDAAEKGGIFTDYDWDDIKASDMDDPDFWKGFFIKRLNASVEALEALGVEYNISRKKGKK